MVVLHIGIWYGWHQRVEMMTPKGDIYNLCASMYALAFLCCPSVFHSQSGKWPHPIEKVNTQVMNIVSVNNGYFVQSHNKINLHDQLVAINMQNTDKSVWKRSVVRRKSL